ncbi:MAG: ATP synthase F1 subunit gamma [Allobaculum sp.]
MAASKQAIKTRIASVASTKKITNAMQMVASAKLNKTRNAMEKNREYATSLQEVLAMVLARADQGSRVLKEDKDKPCYLFVVTSDMGLCGAYNANVFKLLEHELRDGDYVVMIGSHGTNWAKARNIGLTHAAIDMSEEDAYAELAGYADQALSLYEQHKIGAIKVLYTKYINTLTFEPEMETLLPPKTPDPVEEKKVRAETIFEPEKSVMLASLIPMITKSVLYSKYMESKTSEQASRRMAMENATDNAEELEEKLNLEYNRVRQSAITQEITEIVGGANALN